MAVVRISSMEINRKNMEVNTNSMAVNREGIGINVKIYINTEHESK